MNSPKLMYASAAFLILSTSSFAFPVASIEGLRSGAIEVVGIDLKKDAEIKIHAVGMRPPKGDDLNVYAWILDATSREPVWVMSNRRSDRLRGSKVLREVDDLEFLTAGKYELYMYASQHRYWNGDGLGVLLGDLFSGKITIEDDDEDDPDYDRELRDCFVRLESDELAAGDISTFEPTGDLPNAIISHTRLRNSEFIRTGFHFDKEMEIRLYGVLEFPSGSRSPVDNAWITDAGSRDRVWEVNRWNTDFAGGGRKNQVFDDKVSLPRGDYVLTVVTDDSHSWERFNVAPPYDPMNWGITMLPGRDFDKGAFRLVEEPSRGDALISLVRMRDSDYKEQSFVLSSEQTVQVYAIGEYSDGSNEFVDYGGIREVGTGKLVWSMTDRNTDHAGGGEKNRMFDGHVTLPAGTYTAFYVTDDSHSFRDWNTSPPYDQDHYGLSVYPTEETRKAALELIDVDDLAGDSNILARITRVRDDAKVLESFTLDKESRVHIYAIGEGTGGRMYDYAYIVDVNSGKDVWEMTFRRTDHAGGASKNRVFADDVLLPAGEYNVVYVSDGSHSFNDWNSAPPNDPINWGITVSLAGK